MKLILALLFTSFLLTGCALFKTPDKAVAAPAVPKTYSEKSEAWAADVVKEKREAEQKKFEKDLNSSAKGGETK